MQKELLEKFREIENEKSNPSIKKFFQKAKRFLEKLNDYFQTHLLISGKIGMQIYL